MRISQNNTRESTWKGAFSALNFTLTILLSKSQTCNIRILICKMKVITASLPFSCLLMGFMREAVCKRMFHVGNQWAMESAIFLWLLLMVEKDRSGSAVCCHWWVELDVNVTHLLWVFSLSLSLRMECYVERCSFMISFCTAGCSQKWIMTMPCLWWGRTPTLNCVITSLSP